MNSRRKDASLPIRTILQLSETPTQVTVEADALLASPISLQTDASVDCWHDFRQAGKPAFLTLEPALLDSEATLFSLLHLWRPSGLHLSSVNGVADLDHAATLLRVMEVRLGLEPGGMKIVASVAETARASFGLPGLARSTPILIAYLFDADALAADLQLAAAGHAAVQQVRNSVLLAASAAGVPVFADWERTQSGRIATRPQND